MINDSNVLPLWATPLCKTKITPLDENIVHHLTENVEYQYKEYTNAYNSVDLWVLNHEICKPLKEMLMNKVNEFLKYLSVDLQKHKFYITTSWMNKYQHQDFADMHYHSNSLISGVLYFDNCQDTADISFHKSQNHNNLFQDTINIDHVLENNQFNQSILYHQRTLNVQPEQWDLLLFPSFVNHSVRSNKSTEKTRHSLAFNTFVEGTLGSSTSTLFLK